MVSAPSFSAALMCGEWKLLPQLPLKAPIRLGGDRPQVPLGEGRAAVRVGWQEQDGFLDVGGQQHQA